MEGFLASSSPVSASETDKTAGIHDEGEEAEELLRLLTSDEVRVSPMGFYFVVPRGCVHAQR